MAAQEQAPQATPPPNKKEEQEKEKEEEKNTKVIKDEEEELSEEDQQLKSELEMLVDRLQEPDHSLYNPSLNALKNFIRTSTSSMTAVPKPLKFLRPFYPALSDLYTQWHDDDGISNDLTDSLADMLSVLAMTYSDSGSRECLLFRLRSNTSTKDMGSWGHEYVRHLALEIGQEYAIRIQNDDDDEKTHQLIHLALDLVPFFLNHNAEADAVDLLLEVESIDKLPGFVDSNTLSRVGLYMTSCVPLLAPPDDLAFLETAFTIYLNHNHLTEAMTLAIRMDDVSLIKSVFNATNDKLVHYQLAFLLARQQIWIDDLVNDDDDDEQLMECLSNSKLSDYFLYLGKELNILEPKDPKDIYKSNLVESSRSALSLDSAKENLSKAFTNAFINNGFQTDTLITSDSNNNMQWVYKNWGSSMLSAAASAGAIYQWNVENGLQNLDKLMYTSEENVKAGALLGVGIVNAGIHNESDPALALLSEYVESRSKTLKAASIMGLGLAYGGSRREEIAQLLLPVIVDTTQPMEVAAQAALAIGQVFVGSCNGDASSTIIQSLMEREDQLSSKWTRFMALGLALIYMGKPDETDAIIEAVRVIDHPIAQIVEVLLQIVSYAGTGNVLKIQKLLHDCTTQSTKDKEEGGEEEEGQETEAAAAETEADKSKTRKNIKAFQAYSVLGIAVIAMGEDIGTEMSFRHFGHLMHYGDAHIRRAVPLAMGLLSVSNPQIKVYDTLSRYSHDNDLQVAINATFAMGLVGAGTNNARIAQLLRQLSGYYSRPNNSTSFMVRVSQGLVHLGKGTQTLSPFHTNRQILSQVSLSGLLTVLIGMLDGKSFIVDSSTHYLLYHLNASIHPRFLITLNEQLEPIQVNVRVGQAVDTVGQAGRPKTITGWVTQSTPVLLGYGEKAELETDEYISLSSSLEGLIILKKNNNRAQEEII